MKKRRPTLVIDDCKTQDKKKKEVDGFVHREVIHSNEDGSNVKGYEKIEPNPDSTDKEPMYLKSPAKKPRFLFEPFNQGWAVPTHLQEKYEKNNNKEKSKE